MKLSALKGELSVEVTSNIYYEGQTISQCFPSHCSYFLGKKMWELQMKYRRSTEKQIDENVELKTTIYAPSTSVSTSSAFINVSIVINVPIGISSSLDDHTYSD